MALYIWKSSVEGCVGMGLSGQEWDLIVQLWKCLTQNAVHEWGATSVYLAAGRATYANCYFAAPSGPS